MNDAFDNLELQLRRAVRARRPRRRPLRRRGPRPTAIVLIAMLVLSAGALAAGGVIEIGSPAEPHGSRPASPNGGAIVHGTVRVLGVSAADPLGGARWGVRVFSTTAGEGCAQVGRLLQGKLGVIGQDSSFGDDGRFHETSVGTLGARQACTLLDGNNRLFINALVGDIPVSGWVGRPDNGCVPSTAGHYERYGPNGRPYPLCPQRDERNVYFGLLGPDATSITYKLEGRTRTLQTVGPEGAYLLVTPASPTQLFNFNAGGTQDIVPVDGPITELHYRDGSTCHLTSRSWIGGREACSPQLKEPVGWVPPRTPPPSAAQVAARPHVRLVHARDGGYEALVSFRARVAIPDAHSVYGVSWHESGEPRQIVSFERPQPPNPRVGDIVTARITRGGAGGLRRGLLTGEVEFEQQTGPGNLEEAGGTVKRTVARFALDVP